MIASAGITIPQRAMLGKLSASLANIQRVCSCGNAISPTGIVNTNSVVIINQPLLQNSGHESNPVKPSLYKPSSAGTAVQAPTRLFQKSGVCICEKNVIPSTIREPATTTSP